MKQATAQSRTPVVFWAADAIAAGLVHSYRRPGKIIGASAQQYGLPATGLGPGVLRGGGVAERLGLVVPDELRDEADRLI